MDQLFGDLAFVFVYIDDILIITKGDFEQHLMHLKVILQWLNYVILHMHLKKSKFITEEMKSLGFFLSPKGIHPAPEMLRQFRIWVQRNRKELHSFIGLFHGMINQYSEIMAPLTDLLSRK
jgi:Reverse transcriptase (RNA-dependent DNA polymerase)